MTELLPCPFCGGEAECHQWWSATISGKYATVCTKCNCGTDFYATEAEAISAWNTRAVETCKNVGDLSHGASDIFECSECGYGYSDIYLNDEDKYPFVPNYCPNCGAKVVGE